MEQLILAFITGLTTGGLSCLAVQGGLLAGSLARQIEQDLLAAPGQAPGRLTPRPNTALPIVLFLLAKLAVYTLLGALLGLAGAFLTLDPISRAALMIFIGVFMVGNALRMLNVHPIFRYFVIEPPRFITRAIRRTARRETDFFTPLFLGALTVLIPCGVTQAMMAAALGAGSAAAGAALMFAFTLGASPVFFLAAYLAMQIGARLHAYFLRFVAIVVLILGLVSVESGLNVLGSPLSFASLTRSLQPVEEAIAAPAAVPAVPAAIPTTPRAAEATATSRPTPAAAQAAPPAGNRILTAVAPTPTAQGGGAPPVAGVSAAQRMELRVANNGYTPKVLRAPANQKLSLDLVTNRTTSCARDFVIPALKYYKLLPETGRVTVEVPPQKPGAVIRFACSMGMYTGQIVFD
jgi:sulfite exporter TauE/SafE